MTLNMGLEIRFHCGYLDFCIDKLKYHEKHNPQRLCEEVRRGNLLYKTPLLFKEGCLKGGVVYKNTHHRLCEEARRGNLKIKNKKTVTPKSTQYLRESNKKTKNTI